MVARNWYLSLSPGQVVLSQVMRPVISYRWTITHPKVTVGLGCLFSAAARKQRTFRHDVPTNQGTQERQRRPKGALSTSPAARAGSCLSVVLWRLLVWLAHLETGAWLTDVLFLH